MKLILIPIVALLMISCNKTTDSTEPSKAASPNEKTTPQIPYPHDKEFFKNHGKNYYEQKSTCLNCHGADGSGGNTPVSCKTCHGDFPHPKNWGSPKIHPVAYKASSATCIKCHGADLLGGGSQVSCNTCHSTFPHPKGWALPTKHGAAAAADKSECLSCHDSARKEADVVKCEQCHKIYPHPDKFASVHWRPSANTVASNSDVSCLACHTDYTRNLPEDAQCKGCHEDVELKLHWKDIVPPKQGAVHKKSARIPTSWQHIPKSQQKVKSKTEKK